uniref:Uncharacterized protein n=1 Tax=Solanum lycopersicum TaxID=4081 RepID=K4AUL1_SOLLC
MASLLRGLGISVGAGTIHEMGMNYTINCGISLVNYRTERLPTETGKLLWTRVSDDEFYWATATEFDKFCWATDTETVKFYEATGTEHGRYCRATGTKPVKFWRATTIEPSRLWCGIEEKEEEKLRLPKTRKAKLMRLSEMEKREKQRVEEMKETQKKILQFGLFCCLFHGFLQPIYLSHSNRCTCFIFLAISSSLISCGT